MNIFINHTNHPSELWGEAQLGAAGEYGDIVDYKFPDIGPGMDTEAVIKLARENFDRISKESPAAVLCQGESVYVYNFVRMLKDAGIKVLAACSERRVVEHRRGDGTVEKVSEFVFAGFREY